MVIPRTAIVLATLVAAPAPGQGARPDTVEEFVRLYGGIPAARSFAAARIPTPFQADVALAEGCGPDCTVGAMLVEARTRTDTSSRQLCFANPVPLAARLRDEPAYGFVTHAEVTVTTNDGAAVLPCRLFGRMETRAASRAKPNLEGEWCATLPIPPRDARFAYTDRTAARLSPTRAQRVVPVRFDSAGMNFAEILVRTTRPGARIAVSGQRSKLRTPATIALTEAASTRVEVQQGKAEAQLGSCASQWAADRGGFVFDCPI